MEGMGSDVKRMVEMDRLHDATAMGFATMVMIKL